LRIAGCPMNWGLVGWLDDPDRLDRHPRRKSLLCTLYSVTGLAMTTPPPGTNVAYSSDSTTPGGTLAGWILR